MKNRILGMVIILCAPFLFLEMIIRGLNNDLFGYHAGLGIFVFCSSLFYSLFTLKKQGYLQQTGFIRSLYLVEMSCLFAYTSCLVIQLNHRELLLLTIIRTLWIFILFLFLLIMLFTQFFGMSRMKQLILITGACWLFFSIADWVIPHIMPAILCEGLCSMMISFLLGYIIFYSESYKIVQDNMLYESSSF